MSMVRPTWTASPLYPLRRTKRTVGAGTPTRTFQKKPRLAAGSVLPFGAYSPNWYFASTYTARPYGL